MDPTGPKRWHTREDSGIRLDRTGRWWHDGELVDHPKIIEAFNRGLAPAEGGRFKLTFGNDWCFVQVDDAAYQVVLVARTATEVPRLSLSDRTEEPLAPATLGLDDDGVLSCRVKGGLAKARFSRDAQFALGEMLTQGEGGWSLEIDGQRVPVPLPVDQA